jgi:hypothetical protein
MAGKNIHKCCRLCRKHAQDDTSHQKIIEHKLMGPELHCTTALTVYLYLFQVLKEIEARKAILGMTVLVCLEKME